jgi:lipase
VIAPDEDFLEANSIRLHFLRWRPAGKGLPPVLLLHATGFLARLWQPVAEELVERFEVYAYDTRGHGDSDKPPPGGENYHWRELVADLKAFCDALGISGVSIVGHSSGGAAASYLAATYPEHVSRLVLFEPIIFPAQFAPPQDRRNDLAEGARRRRMVWRDAEAMVEAYRERPAFARWPEGMLRLYADYGTFRREDGQVELKCPGEIEAEVFDNSRSLDTWDRLPKIACPALLMHGRLTGELFPSLMEQIAARVQNARIAIVDDAGHLAPMEQPQAVADAIIEFLGEAS